MSSEPAVDMGAELLKVATATVNEVKTANADLTLNYLEGIIFEGMTQAYELGGEHARTEAELVEELTQEVTERRAAFSMQASIAAVMRAAHLDELTLTLSDIATIFHDYELRLTSLDVTSSITYRLTPRTPPA